MVQLWLLRIPIALRHAVRSHEKGSVFFEAKDVPNYPTGLEVVITQ